MSGKPSDGLTGKWAPDAASSELLTSVDAGGVLSKQGDDVTVPYPEASYWQRFGRRVLSVTPIVVLQPTAIVAADGSMIVTADGSSLVALLGGP